MAGGLGFDIAGGVGSALSDFELGKAQRAAAAEQGQELAEDRNFTRQDRDLMLQERRMKLEAAALNNPEAQAARDEADLQKANQFVDTLPIDPKQKALVKGVLRLVPPEHRATILQSIINPKPGTAVKPIITMDQASGYKTAQDPTSGKILWRVKIGTPKATGGSKESSTKRLIEETNAARVAAGQAPMSKEEVAQIERSALDKATATSILTKDQADEIIQGMKNGTIPATQQGMFRNWPLIVEAATRNHFNLKDAMLEWAYQRKLVETGASQTQVGLRQQVATSEGLLNQVQKLYDKWAKDLDDQGIPNKYRALNGLSMAYFKSVGGQVGADAQALQAILGDTATQIGGIYRNGASPTDASLALAAQNLGAAWNPETIKTTMAALRDGLNIRKSAISSSYYAGIDPYSLSGSTDPNVGRMQPGVPQPAGSLEPTQPESPQFIDMTPRDMSEGQQFESP